MKVPELRKEVEKKEKDELINIIVQLYKIVPKEKKEDYNIDYTIIHGITKIQKQEEHVDIEKLSKEIDNFIDLAYDQCYFAPNKIVPKNERPKWRFKVKNYLKLLYADHSPLATKKIIDLYNVLSYACNYWIFSSDNPYRSIGVVQAEMLDKVFKAILYYGLNDDNIKTCIEVLINSNVDRETIHSQLICIFINNLTTDTSKKIAIELLKQMKNELYNKPEKDGKSYCGGKTFQTMEKINNICEAVLRLDIELYQYDEGIHYFIKNYIEDNKEVMYYVLLQIIEDYDLKDQWLKVYESADKKVKFRDRLQEKYKYIKENDDFMN